MSRKVTIVGFGYIGLCIGAVLAEKRYDITGIDTRQDVVDEINAGKTSVSEPGLGDLVREATAGGRLRATTDPSAVADADVVIVTVGTPLGADYEPDLTQLRSAIDGIAPHVRPGQIVVLKSTVPPGTTDRVVRPALETGGLVAGRDFSLAFSPERLAEGRALLEFQSIPVVVGGVTRSSTEATAAFWREALDVDVIEVTDAKAAELTKLADNLWIDLSIAMANELAMLCDRLEVDVLEVIASANSLPKGAHNVNILLPSMGVGGSCLTKDPWFVHHLGELHGLDLRTPQVSRTVNESMPAYTFGLIESGLRAAGKSLETSKVAVLGLAFKNNTGDLRFTPTKDTIALLEQSGCELAVCDPWVSAHEALTITEVPLSATVEEAVKGADVVAFLAGHDDFRRIEMEELAGQTNPGCLIVDGRMYFRRSQIERIRELGMRFRGIGR